MPDFGFIFAAIVLGDAVQLLQAWKTKGLYFPSFFVVIIIILFNLQIQTLAIKGKFLHGRSSN